MDNLLVNDERLKGNSLHFSNLTFSGESLFIDLSNHKAYYLKINLEYSICYLRNFDAIDKSVGLKTGLYSEFLPSNYDIHQVSTY
jgi:hypothetical protein